ncbi:hypothetical protein [Robertkochia sediminum]|uniref:hypothetical protein n=1 Tax=Robertkochia sediminum TaxID=2785326 RepID=UPI0019328098|nr:hypothetical protein [Robertkochia sediminum]MBL7472970.1 hypothetical protein [Robertkochia sediminum]
MTYDQLIDKIASAPVPEPGDVLTNAFELFKKAWLQGLVYILLTFILVLPLVLIIYMPVVGLAVLGEAQGYDMGAQLDGMSWVAMLPFAGLIAVGVLLVHSLVMALQAGLYRSFNAVEHGDVFRVGMLFDFLKWRYIRKTFVLALFSILIALLCLALCVLPILYVWVPLYFVAVIFAFNPDLRPSEIIQAAFKLGNKTWFVSFVLIILAHVLSQMVSFFTCGVGVLFTSAFVYMTVYHIYKGVINDDLEAVEPDEIPS